MTLHEPKIICDISRMLLLSALFHVGNVAPAVKWIMHAHPCVLTDACQM